MAVLSRRTASEEQAQSGALRALTPMETTMDETWAVHVDGRDPDYQELTEDERWAIAFVAALLWRAQSSPGRDPAS